MPRVQVLSLGLAGLLLLSAGATRGEEKVNVRVVKYDVLADVVLDNRGKVVVVAFWTTWSSYDARLLNHLAEVQRRHGKDGLVSVAVNVDLPADSTLSKEKAVRRARRALEKFGPLSISLVLDEPEELVVQKLRFSPSAPPCVYLFDREGRWYQLTSYEQAITPAELETRVGRLLTAKQPR